MKADSAAVEITEAMVLAAIKAHHASMWGDGYPEVEPYSFQIEAMCAAIEAAMKAR